VEANTKVTIEELRRWLLQENKGVPIGQLEQYAHQLLTYFEANVSVLVLGSIVAHPRTAAPMENPHLKVRAQALSSMAKLKRVKHTDIAWKHIKERMDQVIQQAKAEGKD
jgi:hypothetical protein